MFQALGYPNTTSPIHSMHCDWDNFPQVGQLAIPESVPLGIAVSCVGRTIRCNQNQWVSWQLVLKIQFKMWILLISLKNSCCNLQLKWWIDVEIPLWIEIRDKIELLVFAVSRHSALGPRVSWGASSEPPLRLRLISLRHLCLLSFCQSMRAPVKRQLHVYI